MVAVPAYVCGPCTHMQCSQKNALGLVELELQTSEPPRGCWGPDSGSSARAPVALTADRVSSWHQASLVSPTRENLFTQRPCKHPRNLESLSYCSLPDSFISSAIGNHESLWCWTPSTGEGTDAAALEQKSVHSWPQCVWEPGLGQGTPFLPTATAYCFFLFALVSSGNIWISASNTTI